MASNEELTRIADRLEGDIFDAVPDDNRQGQITDAMLLAAMNAKYPDTMPAPDLSHFGTASKDSMRDSLRAALEAAEEARRG